MFNETPLPAKEKSLVTQNVQMLCSLIAGNLDYVNTDCSNWFKSRYILVCYMKMPSAICQEQYSICIKTLVFDMVENY